MTLNVLFVDDEPNVLSGLRRMMRPMRHEWDMTFATSGREALDVLGNGPNDLVVVTDLLMPGMDGVELLREIKRCRPQAVRIILSGHASTQIRLESLGVTHQFFTKPCEPKVLSEAIEAVRALQAVLAHEGLRAVVGAIDKLPSLPKLYQDIIYEIGSERGSIRRVGQIIAADVAMTAKILQIINSAFFGLPNHIATAEEAATLLGMNVVQGLVLSAHVLAEFEQKTSDLDLAAVQRHGERTGALARRIAEAEGVGEAIADKALMAGMLQDVGRLVLAVHPDRFYGMVDPMMRERSIADWEAENTIFEAAHPEVGAYLLGVWGLPHDIVEAVAYHHQPGRSVGTHFRPLTAVHVANALLEDPVGAEGRPRALDLAYLQRLGVAGRIPEWQALLAE
jgi:HD-like signal output (HDOD) protein